MVGFFTWLDFLRDHITHTQCYQIFEDKDESRLFVKTII